MSDLDRAIDGLAGVDVEVMPAPVLGARIRELMRARNRLDGEISRAIAVFDMRGYCEIDGAASTASWLRGRANVSGAEASDRVKTARGLRELPATAAALAAGAITHVHARAITLLAAETSLEATLQVEEQLLALAAMVDPVRFSVELRRLREAWQRDGADGKDTIHRGRKFSGPVQFEWMAHPGGWCDPQSRARRAGQAIAGR